MKKSVSQPLFSKTLHCLVTKPQSSLRSQSADYKKLTRNINKLAEASAMKGNIVSIQTPTCRTLRGIILPVKSDSEGYMMSDSFMWRDGKTMGIERSVVIGDWDGRGINYKGIQQEWLGGWVCVGVMRFFVS